MIGRPVGALDESAVSRTLERLHGQARTEDAQAKRRVEARESKLGRRLSAAERYELYGDAPLAIAPDVGRLYYSLARVSKASSIVEFGASLGISTIYLAAALRDAGGGSFLTTEILPGKAELARRNLEEAGLGDLVEIRIGDATTTLASLDRGVDLLVLDGRNDQYVAVFELVRERFRPGALVLADLGRDDPDIEAYREFVRRPGSDCFTSTLPLDAGVELTILDGA